MPNSRTKRSSEAEIRQQPVATEQAQLDARNATAQQDHSNQLCTGVCKPLESLQLLSPRRFRAARTAIQPYWREICVPFVQQRPENSVRSLWERLFLIAAKGGLANVGVRRRGASPGSSFLAPSFGGTRSREPGRFAGIKGTSEGWQHPVETKPSLKQTWRFNMKMVKSLLLGSAAGLAAVAGAQAADLPVKAKAVEYVKVCSLYGAGFYYIPGTDTCLKIGGFVRTEWNHNAGGSFNTERHRRQRSVQPRIGHAGQSYPRSRSRSTFVRRPNTAPCVRTFALAGSGRPTTD